MIMKKTNRIISLLLVVTMLLPMLPASVFAASTYDSVGVFTPYTGVEVVVEKVTDGELSIGGSNITMMAETQSDGSIIVSANGHRTYYAYTRVTVKNTSDSVQTLSFDYLVGGEPKEFTINGQAANSNSGTFEDEIGSNAVVEMVVGIKNSSSANLSVTLSNFKLFSASNDAKLTLNYDNSLGSVTIGGVAAANASQHTVTADGVTLVATPNTSDKSIAFIGWIGADNRILSTDKEYLFKTENAEDTVTALFVNSSSKAYFKLNGYLYDDLNAANTAAGSSGRIVLLNSGTLAAGNYTINSGVTLQIPFNADETQCTTKPEYAIYQSSYTTPTVYRQLTLSSGANITVNGALMLSASNSGTQGHSGSPSGPCSYVYMNDNSSITLNSGANLYAWGFIYGSGSVTAKSGSHVYECFQIMDWRGGTATSSLLLSKKVFPFTQYYVQNVEVPMALESGATEHIYSAANMSSSLTQFDFLFIGNSDKCFFKLSDGYLIKDYIESKDRLSIKVYGTFALGYMEQKISFYTLDTRDYALPINNNISIEIMSGNTTVPYNMAMLPGSELTIAKGATVTVSNNAQVYVFDANDWNGKQYVYSARDWNPIYYAPGKTYTREAADLVDAAVIVKGTLTTNSSTGQLYTTSAGGGYYHKSASGTWKVVEEENSGGSGGCNSGVHKTYVATQSGTSTSTKEIVGVGIPNYTDTCADCLVATPAVAATCTKSGTAAYWTCSVCGTCYSDSAATAEITNLSTWLATEGQGLISATGTHVDSDSNGACDMCGTAMHVHNFTGAIRNDGNTQNGTHSFLCANGCNEYGGAAAHTWNEGVVTQEPDCTNAGVKTYTCTATDCGATYTEPVTATGHSYTDAVTPPTCTEKGYTTHTCSVCGDVVTDTEVPATGHTAGDEATCVAPQICTVCNTKIKDATGVHTYNVETEKQANTCGEDGYVIHKCATCDATQTTVLKATGNHDLTYQSNDGTGHIPSCKVCDYTGEKQTHSYGDWITDTNATCTTGGTKHQVCETCGYRNEGTIPALNHKDENKDHVCDNGCDVPQGEHADSDTDKDHVCDYCGKAVENGEDCTDSASDGDHNCDVCGKENVTTCADTAPKNHVCDSDSACTAYSTGANEHKDSDKNHTCDYGCSEPIGTCSDAADDGDHVCDYGCGATKSECGDAAKDHVCDTDSACTAYSTDANEHKAAANSHNCAYCGEAVTSCVGNLDKTDENAATCEGTGVKAYWTCSVCGSHYSNEAATAKIENLETWKKTANQGLIAKLGHDMQLSAEAVAPSCEKNGATAVYTCTRNCGHTTGGEKVDALQHNWRVADPVWNGTASVSVSRTCTTVGGCQATETATSTSVKAEVTTQPTYNAKGQTTYTATFSETWASAQKTLTDVAMREGEARVGDTNYGTLADAVANVGQYNTIIVLKNLKVTTPVVIPEGVTVDFNGKTVSGTIAGPGKLALNGGNLITAEGKNMIGSGTENNYYTTNAVISISLDQRMDTIIHSGEVELAKDCWTLENQTLEIKSGATFTVREGIRLEVRSKVIVEGTAVVNGTVNLYSANATIKAASGLNVETTAGDKVLYQNGVYSVHNHTAGEAVVEDKNEPTCTETGSYNSVVYCSVCGDELSTTPVTVDALNHEWNATTYSWGTDGKFCTATRSCGRANCNETETATAEVTSAEKEAATCTEMGWTTYTASFNVTWAETQTQDKQDITVIAHTYTVEAVNENTLKSAATCTEKAVYYYSCQCGAVDMSENAKTFENGEKLGHTYGNPAVTFSEDGKTYTVTVTCSVCAEGNDGHTSTSDTLYSAAGDLVPGTCQAESYQIFTAAGTFEEVSYRDTKTVYGEKGDHSWKEEYGYTEIADSEYNVIGYTFYGSRKCEICSKEETATPTITCVETEKATCVRNGVGTYTVTFAEDWADMKTYAGLTTFVNANNHANEQDCQTQAATCTAVGYTGGKYCYACEVYTVPRTEVPALGHDIVIDAAVAPTCTTTGLTAGRHCSRCDDATVAQEEIRALGHTEATREEKRVEATCGADGSYDLVTYCSVCNEVIKTENKVLNATGNHSDENPYDGSCDVCGTAMTPIHGGEAAIGNAIYPTLADAINAAQPGEFINIRANITSQPTNVTIAKNVTIITNGYSLWSTDAVAAIESITNTAFKVTTNYGIIFVNEAGPEATYVAEVNGVKYTTVKEALENAQPGDTVTMIADSDESQNDLIMISGVKLNTQSFDLSARSFVGFNGSEIYGTTYVTTGAGDCSKLTIKNLILGETGRPNGTYTIIPVYVPNEGYYVFANFRFNTTLQGQGLTIDKTQKRIYLQFNQSISTALNNDILKSQYSAAGNKFRIVVRITWQGKDGVYELDYAYTDQFVINTLMSSNVDYTCVINNYNLIGLTGYAEDSITVQALLVTDSGLIVSSGVLRSK